MHKDGEIAQIAHVVRDLDATIARYWQDFGMGPWDIYTFGPHNVMNSFYRGQPASHVYRIALCQAGPVQIEVMQPVSGRSIYDEFLETRGEGIHHIKLYYRDCAKAVADYQSKGYTVIQSGAIGDDVFYYLDSEHNLHGAILELGNSGSIPPPERRYPA